MHNEINGRQFRKSITTMVFIFPSLIDEEGKKLEKKEGE
jgi:hypothetical protein